MKDASGKSQPRPKKSKSRRVDLEDRLRLQEKVLESAAHAIVITDLKGTIEWVNDAFTTLTLYSREEAIGKNPRHLLKSGFHKREFYTHIWNTILEGRTWRGDIINRRKDGTIYHEDQMITPLRNQDGEIERFVAIKQDVTAQRQSEQALARAEKEYRRLVNDVNDGIFVMDSKGVYTFANRALAKIHGFENERDVVGHSVLEFVAPERVNELKARFFGENSVPSGDTIIEPLVLPDGRQRFVEVKPVPVVERRKIQGFRGVVRDVDDRVRAERDLRLSYHILSKIDNIVCLFDRAGNVTYVSPSAERLLGYSLDELTGDGFWLRTFSDPATAAEDRAIVIRTAAGEAKPREPFERMIVTRDGSTRYLLITESLAGEGTVIRVASDITERRRVEDQFRQAQKMEAIGVLAGGVAHDFNNLLTVINGYTELLLARMPPEDPIRPTLTSIQKAGTRASSLTRQLLAFSRKQIIVPRLLDLNAVIRDMEKMLRRIIGEDIQLTAVLRPEVAPIRADAGQIEQVLMNLAVNARDAMPDGGKLTIETQDVFLDSQYVNSHYDVKSGNFTMLAITDTGCGMDAKTRERIFEPFFTTKEQGKGTGLGLSVVDGIVRQSGGHVEVYSEIDVGTTFKVYLPHGEAHNVVAAVAPGSETLARGSETILLAEDEEGVRALSKHILEMCGYRVLDAGSGHEAIKIAESFDGPIHLVIADVVMPNMGGHALSIHLKSIRPQTRMLFVSGYTDDTVVRHGILDATFNFLQKPFTPVALSQKVREVLGQP